MVVTATEAPTQAEVLFLVEATAANGGYINELKSNYLLPTLEYFHGGPIEEGNGNGSTYGVVAYQTADCHPGVPVSTYGPFTCPQKVVETIDKIEYIGGSAENEACITEALTTALACFEDMGRSEVPRHAILLCCSGPYTAYAGGLVPAGCPATIETAARQASERGVQLSVICGRKLASLLSLYENASGDLHAAQQRNYAKDPRHLVLLRGYSLKERPPSPAPPPAPDHNAEAYGRGGPAGRGAGAGFPRGPPRAWLPPPQPRAPLYNNNSALLTQLAQPSLPPPPHHPGLQRMPNMLPSPAGAGSTSAPAPAPAPTQRPYIWSGVIEWTERGKGPTDQQKVIKMLPCQVSAHSKDVEPELKVDTWPNKLLMQLITKQVISSAGGEYLKDSKSVVFHIQHNEALEALNKLMVNGFAGCVHFSPPHCDIKVLILLYTPDKNAYVGFIPNNQTIFVERLRQVIQKQKMSQMINKQLPAGGMAGGSMLPANMPANIPGNMPANMQGASSSMGGGMAQGMPAPPQQQMQHRQVPQQNMMMGGGMGAAGGAGGGKGARGVTQLDGLEAARQQNLEKIQHLQQTLEAAHQQEAQFKTQMDIMSQLHAAQQQDQHYKQLEEQQRKHQLQQQLQQQLRGAAPLGARGRSMLPANPGLRHLLQQQPQYRPGGPGPGPRPPSQGQFEDVNNYDFL